MKKTNFLFILTEKVEDATATQRGHIYEAQRTNEGSYLIGFYDYGILKTIYLSADDVAEFLSQGYWEMLTEHEAEQFIKGLY